MVRIYIAIIILAAQGAQAIDLTEKADRHSLVDIFCSAIVENQLPNRSSKKMEEIWPELELHFESGKLLSSLLSGKVLEDELKNIQSTPLFKKCVDQNQKDFEYGEFLISGRDVLRNTIKSFKKPSTEVFSTVSLSLNDSFDLPYDLSLNLSDNSLTEDNTQTVEKLVQREKKYEVLWRRFIADVKSRSKSLGF